jgi:4-hydroxyproline epimerase
LSEVSELFFPEWVSVVDSHTEGGPTRVIVDGWPMPSGTTMAERQEDLRRRCSHLQRAVVGEPRGHDAVMGALLTPPTEPGSMTGVIFFDSAGDIGMCGHGLIGVVRTLEHLGRLAPGSVRIDTPAGTVKAELVPDGAVTIEIGPARCHARDVPLDVPGVGRIVGDVAWGGYWFFLARLPGITLELAHAAELKDKAIRIRNALRAKGITGDDGSAVDNVQLFGPARRQDADSRNFVLFPGDSFDRSPCGTGTSARMATLHARGLLRLGQPWRQESITGSLFTGWLTRDHERLIPHIRGHAFVTGRGTLFFNPADTLRGGLPAD